MNVSEEDLPDTSDDIYTLNFLGFYAVPAIVS